jgi:uncharacterized protein
VETIAEYHIDPRSGVAFEVGRGQVLRVIDAQGEQVSDLMAFRRGDSSEWLSGGRSIDYANTIYLTTGHILYSNKSNPMLTILEDRVGKHDFLLTPCSQEMFRLLYRHEGYHPSCYGNLATNLARFGIAGHQIPTTFNIFMNVDVGPSGELTIGPPLSKAGDFVELRAEQDLIVGLTACSAEKSNNGRFKPIDAAVYA